MDINLIAEKLTDLDFIPLASVQGEFFSIYCEFNAFSELSINNYRLAYLREKFGDNQYSARWQRLYLKDKETLIFRLSDFAGMPRELQLKSRTARGDLIRLYVIEPSISGSGNSPEATQQGIRGEYHSGTEFNDIRLTRIDPELSFNWGQGSPDASLPGDNFSIVWRGFIFLENDADCTFSIQSGKEIELKIDGQPLSWSAGTPGNKKIEISMSAGNTPFEFRFIHRTGKAFFSLKLDTGNGLNPIGPSELRY